MKLSFFMPSAAQRAGGLDAAIDGLRGALRSRGVEVEDELPRHAGDDRVVHFHGLWQPSHARASLRCAMLNLPAVVSPHGMLEPWAWRHKRWKKLPYFQLVEKAHLSRADALLATAPAEASRLAGFIPTQRIETLPLGLTGDARPDYENARRILGWAPHERVLLFLSRIHPKKGLDLLLRALSKMRVPNDVRLVVVGDGEKTYVQQLQNFAARNAHRLPPIDWRGAVWGEARWSYFQGADLFCLPTHSENFGLAVLESCQVGTPAMTTVDTPWADHFADHHGFIGHPTAESLREMLSEFFAQPATSPAQRQELADWAWARFHWEPLGARYVAFYEGLLRSNRHRPRNQLTD